MSQRLDPQGAKVGTIFSWVPGTVHPQNQEGQPGCTADIWLCGGRLVVVPPDQAQVLRQPCSHT